MDSLSPELLDAIVGYLGSQERLAPLATLSRPWQYAVERRTFRSLIVRSTHLDDFAAIVVDSRRRALRELEYHAILPTFGDPDTDADRARNNAAFTDAVRALLRALSAWDVAEGAAPVSLSVEAYSVNKHGFRRHVWERRLRPPAVELLPPSATTAFASSAFSDESLLPSVPLVTSLRNGGSYSVSIPGASMAAIAARLPRLANFSGYFHDDAEMLDVRARRSGRRALAAALDRVPVAQLARLSIHVPSFCPSDERRAAPNALLEDEDAAEDRLSAALNRLLFQAPSLSVFAIKGGTAISSRLFRLPSPRGGTSSPLGRDEAGAVAAAAAAAAAATFPSLEHVDIEFVRCAPDGAWYFDGDGEGLWSDEDELGEEEEEEEAEEDDDGSSSGSAADDDYGPEHFRSRAEQTGMLASGAAPTRPFRARAVPALVRPLLVAAAQAAARMPRLKSFRLRAELLTEEARDCGVEFAAAGVQSMLDRDFGETMGDDRARARCYTCVPGLEGDAQIGAAWGRVREGCLVREVSGL